MLYMVHMYRHGLHAVHGAYVQTWATCCTWCICTDMGYMLYMVHMYRHGLHAVHGAYVQTWATCCTWCICTDMGYMLYSLPLLSTNITSEFTSGHWGCHPLPYLLVDVWHFLLIVTCFPLSISKFECLYCSVRR